MMMMNMRNKKITFLNAKQLISREKIILLNQKKIKNENFRWTILSRKICSKFNVNFKTFISKSLFEMELKKLIQ
jgi:hypothetical protein